MLRPMQRVVTTASVEPTQRIAFWTDLVCDTYVQLECDAPAGERAAQVRVSKQAVEADRGPDAGEPPRREQAGEVVVSPPRGDAAELLVALHGGLEDDPRVIVESPRQTKVQSDPVLGDSRRVEHSEDRPEIGDPLGGARV